MSRVRQFPYRKSLLKRVEGYFKHLGYKPKEIKVANEAMDGFLDYLERALAKQKSEEILMNRINLTVSITWESE